MQRTRLLSSRNVISLVQAQHKIGARPTEIVTMSYHHPSTRTMGFLTMLDGVSLDQLRTFIAAVDEGSFSAAS